MPYSQQVWNNGPTSGTPLNALRLNHIEAGIKEASDRLDILPNSYAPKLHAAQHGPVGSDPLSGYYAPVNPPVFESVKVGEFVHGANTAFFANTGWSIAVDNRSGGTMGTTQAAPMKYTIPLAGRYEVELRLILGNSNSCPFETRIFKNSVANIAQNWIASENVFVNNQWYGNGVRARTNLVLALNDSIFWWTAAGAGGCSIYESRGITELSKMTIRYVGPT